MSEEGKSTQGSLDGLARKAATEQSDKEERTREQSELRQEQSRRNKGRSEPASSFTAIAS